ncbi:hypothetical protein LTR56_022703 [Elasticomyces elasticus]|nr:hypothetical protein LTR56_022703 [Elasticomyces elasticus]KAK3641709.1 hypothetical protein LTR22_016417 [Elasticomyces elasticus]KAK4917303.1 hypothetical protein LTR49_014787 [Elasticomyces elasticus]KAK5764880.1 hypothetical protein LTS12_004907 [Elasticomyces elasticus]
MQWMNLPSQRAVSGAPAATARLYLARQAGEVLGQPIDSIDHWHATAADSGHSSRLPSTRPLDRRWDRSRGIVFANVRPAHNRTVLTKSFSTSQVRKRSRELETVSRPRPLPSIQEKPVSGSVYDNPHQTPTFRPPSQTQQSERLRKENEILQKGKMEAEQEARAAVREQQALKAKFEVLEQKLRMDLKAYQQKQTEHKTEVANVRKEANRAAQQQTDALISRLRNEYAAQVANTENQEQHNKQLQQQLEHSREAHERALASQRQADQRQHNDDVQTLTKQRKIRQSERQSYYRYRKVWTDLDDDVRALYNPVITIRERVFAVAARYSEALPSYSSRMDKINPLLTRTNAKLFAQLDDSLEDFAERSRASQTAVETNRSELRDVWDGLQVVSHYSRELTRFHRLEHQTEYSATDMAYYTANEKPLRDHRNELDAEIDELDSRDMSTMTLTAQSRHRMDVSTLKQRRSFIAKLINYHFEVREEGRLRALLTGSITEKVIFGNTRANEDEIKSADAARRARDTVDRDSRDSDGRSVGVRIEQKKSRTTHVEDVSLAREKLRDLRNLMRKRVLLQIQLDQIPSGLKEELEGLIRERLGAQGKVVRDALADLTGVRSSSSFARSRSVPATPSFARAEPSTIVPAERGGRRVRVLSAAARIKPASKPLTPPSPSASSTNWAGVEAQLRDVNRQITQLSPGKELDLAIEQKRMLVKETAIMNLDKLEQKRKELLAANPVNRKALGVLNANIKGCKENLAGRSNNLLTGIRRRVRRHDLLALQPKGDLENEMADAASLSTMNFRPTASLQAQHVLHHLHDMSIDTVAELYAAQHRAQDISCAIATVRHDQSGDGAKTSPQSPQDSRAPITDESAATNAVTATDISSISSTPSDIHRIAALSIADSPTLSTMPLTYRIPTADYRDAVKASPNTNAAYWSYHLYKNAAGHGPTVHYCTKLDQAERVLQDHFRNQPVLGFDIEWEMRASKTSSAKQNVSLIQVACEDRICLIHVANFPGTQPDELVPATLREILESDQVVKAGVNIGGDARRMREYLNVDMRGQFELSYLFKVVTFSRKDINRSLKGASLAAQVQSALLLPLNKGEVRVSSWSKKLSKEQADYSASDAYAGFQLFHALEAKRLRMDPTPPRPAFRELEEPLVLGDGTVLRPQPYKPRAPAAEGKAEELDDDAEEEFFDALETQAPPDTTADTKAGASASNEAVQYPILPSLDPPAKAAAGETGTASFSLPLRPAPTITPEMDAANNWIVIHKSRQRNVQAKDPSLRAYFWWHMQGNTVAQTAALARDPPLAHTTVASYILEAIRWEELPFEAQRVKIVLEILPRSVWTRYWKIVEKIEAQTST